jgi:pyruvate formate lyase activating enzyme
MSIILEGKKKCEGCGEFFKDLSFRLKYCPHCIKKGNKRIKSEIEALHKESRVRFDLPPTPPKGRKGIECTICANRCKIEEGKSGYCGLRKNEKGRLVHLAGMANWGALEWYYDPLPTNCVADWVCEGGKDVGKKNLAVFYNACSFNCLFCQNWHYRERVKAPYGMSAGELAKLVDATTGCICYFGGDPTPQIFHSLATSRIVSENHPKVRICWETNGNMDRKLLEEAAALAIRSNGCIKFDLKAWDENLHLALCGVSNKRTLENFAYLGSLFNKRPEPPLLVASTLLVPLYIDSKEVEKIASFIASLNPYIPYSLLAFYPHFYMNDLSTTSRRQAEECFQAAKKAGLKRVRIGNPHLLS